MKPERTRKITRTEEMYDALFLDESIFSNFLCIITQAGIFPPPCREVIRSFSVTAMMNEIGVEAESKKEKDICPPLS